MNKQYSSDFKLEAVKRFENSEKPLTKIAAELGVKPTTIQGWANKCRKSPEAPFPGSGKLNPEDEKLRKLERENRKLKEENEILKKAAAYVCPEEIN